MFHSITADTHVNMYFSRTWTNLFKLLKLLNTYSFVKFPVLSGKVYIYAQFFYSKLTINIKSNLTFEAQITLENRFSKT